MNLAWAGTLVGNAAKVDHSLIKAQEAAMDHLASLGNLDRNQFPNTAPNIVVVGIPAALAPTKIGSAGYTLLK